MGCFRKNRVIPTGSASSDSSLHSTDGSLKKANSRLAKGQKFKKALKSNKVSPNGSPVLSMEFEEPLLYDSTEPKPFDSFNLDKLTDPPIRLCGCNVVKPEPITLGKKAKKVIDHVLQLISCGKISLNSLNPLRLFKKNQVKPEQKKPRHQCNCRNPYPERIATAAFHQGSTLGLIPNFQLKSPGISCASQALTAAYCHHMSPASSWVEEHLNHILLQGDELHARTLYARGSYGYMDDMLTLDEVASDGVIFGQYFKLDESTFPIGGNLFKHVEPFPTIEDLVSELMARGERSSFLLRILNYTIAILVEEDGGLYVFDSHERNDYGAVDENGRASVFKFQKASNFAAYLMAFCLSVTGLDDPSQLPMEDQSFEIREIKFLEENLSYLESDISSEDIVNSEISKLGLDLSSEEDDDGDEEGDEEEKDDDNSDGKDDEIIFGSELYEPSSEDELF